MKRYYIYHIEGVKIGVSTNPQKRVSDQGYSNFEVLEEHTDIYIVSEREQELQKQYGYKVDTILYSQSVSNRHKFTGFEEFAHRFTKEDMAKGGRKSGLIVGRRNVESGQFAAIHRQGVETAVASPNNVNKQMWLLPDGTTTSAAWRDRNCKKRNLNPDDCIRIK